MDAGSMTEAVRVAAISRGMTMSSNTNSSKGVSALGWSGIGLIVLVLAAFSFV
jgi:hypothetical protein